MTDTIYVFWRPRGRDRPLVTAPVTAFWYAFRLSGRCLAGIGSSKYAEGLNNPLGILERP